MSFATDSPEVTAIDSERWTLSGQIGESEPVREYQIHQGVFSIGRRSNSTLCLPINSVSKCHAEIVFENGILTIRDLGSTNGTFVNGNRIEGIARVNDGDLLQFAELVFRVRKNSHVTEHQTIQQDQCDQALALIQFDRLIESGAFFPYFQPIVRMADQSTVGFEVLGRSRLFGLQTPLEMFHAATQLNLECQLSEIFRQRGVEIGTQLGSHFNLFVNTHPKELGTEDFYKSLYELRENCQQTLTLEIHERAATNPRMMTRLSEILKDLNINLAFDDFGVGEARLVELGEFRPEFLKFDMELTRHIDTASPKRLEITRLLAKLAIDLGIRPLAEGIENLESHQILLDMGFDLGQGYFYGKPAPVNKFLQAVP